MLKKFFYVLFFLTPLFSFSLETVPDDTNEEWKILIADLICSETDSGEAKYIGKTLSNAIFNHLSVLRTHTLSEDEREALQIFLKDKYIEKRRKTLAGYYKDFDNLLFEGNVSVSERNRLESNIAKEEKSLRKLNHYPYSKIYLKNERRMVYLNGTENISTVLKSPAELTVMAEKSKADYIVWGSLRIVDDVVIADLYVFSGILGKNIKSVSIADDVNSIYRTLGNDLQVFYETILGTKWAMVNVTMNNQDGNIFVDNQYAGTGNTSHLIMLPGEHTVKLVGTNMEGECRNITVSDGQILDLDFEVKASDEKMYAVSSFPSGADVYYNSIWQGQTPMILQGDTGEIIISVSGYRDFRTFLEDEEGSNITAFPQKDLFDREKYLKDKRNAFYRSLTYFVLSIPVPFFTYANYLAYDDKYEKAKSEGINQHEIDKNCRIRDYSKYAYWGSLFLSVTLFANAMVHLRDYINAGSASTKK